VRPGGHRGARRGPLGCREPSDQSLDTGSGKRPTLCRPSGYRLGAKPRRSSRITVIYPSSQARGLGRRIPDQPRQMRTQNTPEGNETPPLAEMLTVLLAGASGSRRDRAVRAGIETAELLVRPARKGLAATRREEPGEVEGLAPIAEMPGRRSRVSRLPGRTTPTPHRGTRV
jgi:hypothetical protein